MRPALLLVLVGLAALVLTVGRQGQPVGEWTPALVQVPSFGPASADPTAGNNPGHTHRDSDREWCRMSIGDTDGDGYTEQVPCDPQTRAAATAALAGLHDQDRSEVAP